MVNHSDGFQCDAAYFDVVAQQATDQQDRRDLKMVADTYRALSKGAVIYGHRHDRWSTRASKCRTLAGQFNSEVCRTHLLRLAEAYDLLADYSNDLATSTISFCTPRFGQRGGTAKKIDRSQGTKSLGHVLRRWLSLRDSPPLPRAIPQHSRLPRTEPRRTAGGVRPSGRRTDLCFSGWPPTRFDGGQGDAAAGMAPVSERTSALMIEKAKP